MKLESLARMNGFESGGAHSAIFDAELTLKVLGLIKKKQQMHVVCFYQKITFQTQNNDLFCSIKK